MSEVWLRTILRHTPTPLEFAINLKGGLKRPQKRKTRRNTRKTISLPMLGIIWTRTFPRACSREFGERLGFQMILSDKEGDRDDKFKLFIF